MILFLISLIASRAQSIGDNTLEFFVECVIKHFEVGLKLFHDLQGYVDTIIEKVDVWVARLFRIQDAKTPYEVVN